MAKRKHYSTEEPPEQDLRSRSDGRRERLKQEEALIELADQLTRLDVLDCDRLDLPEAVEDTVAAARLCKSGTPRNRALRRVRAALRDLEDEILVEIRQRLS